MLKNTTSSYGWLAIVLHWLTALLVFTVFALGLWIVDMDYYDPWYRKGPMLHMSIGLVVWGLAIFRLTWRITNVQPAQPDTLKTWERVLSHIVHVTLYILLLLVPVLGYLLTSSDGKDLSFFSIVNIPALFVMSGSEDWLAEAHEISAYSMIALVCLHLLAALKHHFIDKDETLLKMIRTNKRDKQ